MMNLNNNLTATATTTTATTITNAIIGVINAIDILHEVASLKILTSCDYTIREKQSMYLFYTKQFLTAIIEKDMLTIEALGQSVVRELHTFEEVLATSPEKFMIVSSELISLGDSLNGLKDMEAQIKSFLS